MADYNSSLPVRTETAGDVIAKIADATTPSQQLKVYANGSIDVNTTFPSVLSVTQGTTPWIVDGSAYPQPVTGTFWQATQPVSGTFWQTTQPVSGSVSISNFPADADALAIGSTTAGQLGALG